MKPTEFEKAFDASRKTVGKRFGFKKCGYISYAVIDGYFFCITYLSIYNTRISLTVKPFYADDLWYDIYLIPECKRPISLRGNGPCALWADEIADIEIFSGSWKNLKIEDFDKIWTSVFEKIQNNIANFLKENPNADTFIPQQRLRNGQVSLLHLMALIHNGRAHECIDLIKEDLKRHTGCRFSKYINGKFVDGCEFILMYIESLQ